MKKYLPLFSSYIQGLTKICYILLFLLSTSVVFGQTITPTKTVTVQPGSCGIIDVELKVQGANPINRPLDVVLVIDVSGSMGNTIPGDVKTSMDYAKDAANSFIDQILVTDNPTNNNRISIVKYSTTATIVDPLTAYSAANLTALHNHINALIANGNTNIQDGIVKADDELTAHGNFNCQTARSIVLLTDGVANRTGAGGSSCTSGTGGTCITNRYYCCHSC